MGRIEQTTGGKIPATAIGGPEYFRGGKVPFTYEALAFTTTSARPDSIKDSLFLSLQTNSQARNVLTILKKRYVLHALLETSPKKLQVKRASELDDANRECDRRLEGMLAMADGYAYNQITATLRTVKQLEASYRIHGEEFPLSAVDDILAEVLAKPAPVEPHTSDPSNSPDSPIERLAELWSGNNFKPVPKSPRDF